MAFQYRYQGNLKNYSFPHLLHFLWRQQETGTLYLRRENVEKVICIQQGTPLYIESSLARESFLRACVARGKMPIMGVVGLADQAVSEQLPPEQVAIDQRILTQDMVKTLLEETQRLRLLEIFSWKKGEFYFDFDVVPEIGETVGMPDRPVLEYIQNGIRDQVDMIRIRGIFKNRMDLVPAPRFPLKDRVTELNLKSTEMDLVSSLDGQKNLSDVLAGSTASAKETLKLIYLLEVMELIELIDPDEAVLRSGMKEGDFKDYTFELLEYARIIDENFDNVLTGNFFSLFAVPRDYSEDVLRRGYYGLAQKYRPDELYGKSAKKVKLRADIIFERLSAGYEALSDMGLESSKGHVNDYREMGKVLFQTAMKRYAAERDYLQGREMLELGNLSGAREFLEKSVREREHQGEYWAYKGHVEFRIAKSKADKDQADAALKRALAYDANCVPALRFQSEVAESLGQFRKALHLMKRAVLLKPGSRKIRKAFKRLELLSEQEGRRTGQQDERRIMEEQMNAFIEENANAGRYEVLGLTKSATPGEIRQAYFRLAKEYHPDRVSNILGDLNKYPQVEQIFQMINEAYQLLSNDQLRTSYDSGLDVRKQEDQIRQTLERKRLDELIRRGETAVKEENYQSGLDTFNKILEYDPGKNVAVAYKIYIEYIINKSDNMVALSEYEERFKEVATQEPRLEKIYLLWGMMYKREGNLTQALTQFQKAVDLNSNNVDALREVRLIHMRNADKESPKQGSVLKSFLGIGKKQ